MNTILNSLSEADTNKSFLTIYKDGANFNIKLSDFASAISKGSLKLLNGIDLSASLTEVTDGMGTASPLQLSTDQVGISRTVALSAGATNPRLFNEAYTINNPGAQTGTLTGIFLNATETALNGMTHNLMDLQVGGLSKFRIRNNNHIDIYNATQLNWVTYGAYIYHDANNFQMSTPGSILFAPTTGLLKLGGTTNLFPSIARSNTNIIICLADATAGAGLGVGMASATGIVASAILQADSTTKGFLMPRMTTAQVNAIVSPANGLMVYNTDLAQPCFYDGTGWRKVTHTNM
jgi:hypothetical protein